MAENHTNSDLITDVAIVGGGLVGMALALSLAQHKIKSVLLEAAEIPDNEQASFDDRTLVINPAAQNFWQSLNVWSEVEPLATAIDHVHVSNQGRFGVVNFSKEEMQVPQLGHVVAAKSLASLLLSKVRSEPLIEYLQPATLTTFEQQQSAINLHANKAQESIQISARLMVAADGVTSSIRKQLQLSTSVKSYERTAIICNIQTNQNHGNRAFERLTQEGPMALLPFHNRFGFVWSMNKAKADELMATDDAEFMRQAQQQFGHRAGQFQKIGRRSCYPLYQIKVPVQFADRVVLMGNAAHAVSPVSAQGLNLAVRGIKRLTEVLHNKHLLGMDLGAAEVLEAYQLASAADQNRTLNYTDDLMTWFKIDEPVVNAIRSMGLVAINSSLSLKRSLFETAGGLK